jgi:hypothetical protein
MGRRAADWPCRMAAVTGSDILRFPPRISADIAAEIEAIAWSRTDLLHDIPEQDPDSMYLASMYADAAAELWESDNECPPGYLPLRIIDAARKALIPRIEAEIERRDRLVRDEYDRRLRLGRIDVNGGGDVPSYYGIEDIEGSAAKPGRESEPTGWMSHEVLIMSIIENWGLTNFWHFECPECGLSSAELGPADAHTYLCEVCMEEDRPVRLRRWPVELSPLPISAR